MTTRTDRLQVIFEVAGDGKLKATLGDIGKHGERAAEGLDKTSAAHQRMLASAKAAGAVLGTALVGAIGLVIKNTMEAEAVSAQLDARLKSTAGAAGMTRAAIDDLAEATARKTTYDDDAIKSLSAMLLTFTKVHADVFPRATAAITDMATAMGTDLQTATIQVGKALNDPIQGVSALTRVGVQFNEEQKNVIKRLEESGRTMEAQTIILRELETQFGGAAEAARGTFGGALTALKNTLMDLTEGSGGSLDGATQAINDLTDTLNSPDVRAGFAAIVSGVASVTGEVLQGIGILAQYIQKYRDIAALGGANPDLGGAGGSALNNRLASVGSTLGKLRKGHTMSALYSADSALEAGDMMKSRDTLIRELEAERQSIVREMTKRIKADAIPPIVFAGSGAEPAGLFRNPAKVAPLPPATPKPGAGGRAARSRAMPDFGADDLRDLQRLVEETARADEQFARLAATLAGPLAAAEYEHQQNLREITELGEKAGRSAEDMGRLREAETARYREEAAAIAERQNPAAQLLRDLQFELELLGMTNAERATAIDLRRLEGNATAEQAAEIRALHEAREAAGRALGDQIETMDSLRDSARGFLDDLSRGVGVWDSLKNAADSFADTLFDIASKRLIEQIFGGYGTTGPQQGGSGAQGGWVNSLLSIFGNLFGGPRAQGGATRRGSYYEVAEHGRPELYRENGRSWLIPGGNGYVRPLAAGHSFGGGDGGAQYFSTSITVRGDVNQRNAKQLARARGAFMAQQAKRA
jgi:hypothetical protein